MNDDMNKTLKNKDMAMMDTLEKKNVSSSKVHDLLQIPENQTFLHTRYPKDSLISKGHRNFYNLIQEMVVTEKSLESSEENVITFKVALKCTKRNLIGFIEQVFKIAVEHRSVKSMIRGNKIAVFAKKKKREKKVNPQKYMRVTLNKEVDINLADAKKYFDREIMEE